MLLQERSTHAFEQWRIASSVTCMSGLTLKLDCTYLLPLIRHDLHAFGACHHKKTPGETMVCISPMHCKQPAVRCCIVYMDKDAGTKDTRTELNGTV